MPTPLAHEYVIAAAIAAVLAMTIVVGCANPTRASLAPGFEPAQIERLVVVAEDSTGRFRSPAILRQVEDEFARHLLAKGYRVAARTDVAAVEDEIYLQRTKLTSESAAEIGRFLDVGGVVVVSVTQASVTRESRTRRIATRTKSGPQTRSQRYTAYVGHGAISARLIDLDGDVLWIGTFEARRDLPGRYQVEHVLWPIAGTVAGAFPARWQDTPDYEADGPVALPAR